MLGQQESLLSALYGNLKQAMLPSMDETIHEQMKTIRAKIKKQGSEKIVGNEAGMKNAGKPIAPSTKKRLGKLLTKEPFFQKTGLASFGNTLLQGNTMEEKPTTELLGQSDAVGIYF